MDCQMKNAIPKDGVLVRGLAFKKRPRDETFSLWQDRKAKG